MPADRSIDGFPIIRELGRGAMGVVYEARHPELDRTVALKLFNAGADSVALLRFAREAELLARVKHPNVLAIHTFGNAPEGPYLVTERVEGTDLQELLRNGRFDPGRAAALVEQVARGVAALHAQGVIHRDLKPANVIVDDADTPTLLDFGLAMDVSAERLTQTGAVIGTPGFMSPEQADIGSARTTDPRVDVYGLGAILFALLSGHPPFSGGSLLSILANVMSEEPRWPSRDHPEIPPDLDVICKRAMAKRPADRYPTADALADDLARLLAGEELEGQPPLGVSPASIAIGAVVLFVAAVAVTLLALWAQPAEHPTVEHAAPTAKPLSRLEIAQGDRDLRDCLLREGRPRLEALERWVHQNPRHPKATEAKTAYRKIFVKIPVAVVDHYPEDYTHQDRRVNVRFVDANRIATWGGDHRVRLWRLDAPPTLLWTSADYTGHPRNDLRVTPDRRELIAGGSRSYRLSVATGKRRPFAPLKDKHLRSMVFSSDGSLFAVGTHQHGVLLIAWPSGKILHTFAEKRGVRQLAFSPSGEQLAAANGTAAVKRDASLEMSLTVWNLKTFEARPPEDLNALPTALLFPTESSILLGNNVGMLLTVGLDGAATSRRAWVGSQPPKVPATTRAAFDTEGLIDRLTFIGGDRAHPSGVVGLGLAADGATLFSAGGAEDQISEFKVWNYPAGTERRSVAGLKRTYHSFDLYGPGNRFAVGDYQGMVRVFVAERE